MHLFSQNYINKTQMKINMSKRNLSEPFLTIRTFTFSVNGIYYSIMYGALWYKTKICLKGIFAHQIPLIVTLKAKFYFNLEYFKYKRNAFLE